MRRADPLQDAIERFARLVETAVADGNSEKLRQLATARTPDPWLVADHLCATERDDAAGQFASLVPGAEGAGLVAHLEQCSVARDRDAGRECAFERARRADARARQLRRENRLGDSVDAFLEAAEAAARARWLGGQAQSLRLAGRSALQIRNRERAAELWQACLEVETERGNRRGQASVRNYLGNICGELGRYRDALEHYCRAAELCEADADAVLRVRILRNTGVVQSYLGRPNLALVCYERAVELARKTGNLRLVASLQILVAESHRKLGNPARTNEIASDALAKLEHAGDDAGIGRSVASAHGTIGLAYVLLEDYQQALQHLRQAREIYARLDDGRAVATATANLALAHMYLGELEKAEELQREALSRAREIPDSRLEGIGHSHLSRVLRLQGRFDEARISDEASLQIGARLESAHILMLGHLGVAERSYAQHEFEDAAAAARMAVEQVRWLVAGLATEQDARAREHRAEVFEVGIRAALAMEDPREFWWMLESGRAGALLESLGGAGEVASATVPDRLLRAKDEAFENERRALRALKEAQHSGDAVRIEAARGTLAAARSGIREVIGRIERETKGAANVLFLEPVTLEESQADLRPKQALIGYSLLEPDAAAIVITPGDARVVRLPATREILRHVDALGARRLAARADERGRRPSPRIASTATAIARLRAAILDPLALSAESTSLLISPDGPLSHVPFVLLAPEREITYVPSGTTYRLLRSQRPDEPGQGVLALGDPIYVEASGLPRLTHSAAEVRAIATDPLLRERATEAQLRTGLPRHRRWRAVHLACHGKIDAGSPLDSYLALTANGTDDGRLTMLEVLRLPVRADLAVLSACQTGRGKLYRAEGIVGFTRAFMTAGASSVLVSLWNVQDEATEALMTRFYELWNPGNSASGIPASAALKQAQEFVRSQPKWRTPYFWAAWQLWGLPR